MTIRTADELDEVELYIAERLAPHLEPLVIRLRTKTLGRAGHARLVAIMAENALVSGQPEAHAAVAKIIARHWRWCPMRYVPIPARWQAAIFDRLGL